MKKFLSLVLALMLTFGMTAAFAEAAQPTNADAAAAQDERLLTLLTGEEGLPLVFTGNPTTGYEWTSIILDESTLSMGSEYFADAAGDDAAAGAGGLYVFTLKGLAEGENFIAFEYKQPWDDTSTIVSLMYAVKIDANLKVTIVGATAGV